MLVGTRVMGVTMEEIDDRLSVFNFSYKKRCSNSLQTNKKMKLVKLYIKDTSLTLIRVIAVDRHQFITMTTCEPPPGAVLAAPPGHTVVYQAGVTPILNRKAAKITGYTQIALAIASVIVGVIGFGLTEQNDTIPIWGGLGFYLVAGILGVIAGNRGSRCPIIGCMVMSILSAVVASDHILYGIKFTISYGSGVPLAINIFNTLIGVAEMIAAITASAYMCGGTGCCCSRSQRNTARSQAPVCSYVVQSGQVIQPYPMMQHVGQQPIQYAGQPQYTGQGYGMAPQLPSYTEHETKQEIP